MWHVKRTSTWIMNRPLRTWSAITASLIHHISMLQQFKVHSGMMFKYYRGASGWLGCCWIPILSINYFFHPFITPPIYNCDVLNYVYLCHINQGNGLQLPLSLPPAWIRRSAVCLLVWILSVIKSLLNERRNIFLRERILQALQSNGTSLTLGNSTKLICQHR